MSQSSGLLPLKCRVVFADWKAAVWMSFNLAGPKAMPEKARISLTGRFLLEDTDNAY